MSPLSPILTDFYLDHANHYHLVTQEPMLCCTILCLSSRYNTLPVPGASSRGYQIHDRLWDHCQHIILRVMLGQEKSSKAKTRTLGTIEALLLLTEWHPQALHFPPPNDGWDSDLLLSVTEERDEVQFESQARGSWLEDVINPARRSDRMSWMLVGCAFSLAHELGVFDENAQPVEHAEKLPGEQRRMEQRHRLRKLLYLYIEQLSSRLGCKSIMHYSLSHSISSPTGAVGGQWQSFVMAWIDLTKMLRSVSDTLFQSPTFTKHLLYNGRYISLIEHFRPLLETWKQKNLDKTKVGDHFYDILRIEYSYARIYTSSLGLQAAVERILTESPQHDVGLLSAEIDSTDYGFIRDVVDESLEILEVAIKLATTQVLLYSPVRIFLRITTASVFLLKGLSLGVNATKLNTALSTLTQAIGALRSGALDDMHLGSRYATLLERHVENLQKSFIPSARPPSFATRPPSIDDNDAEGAFSALESGNPRVDPPAGGFSLDSIGAANGSGIEDWLTLPFDPSMVPFLPGDNQSLSWLADGTLDFIWNLEDRIETSNTATNGS